MQQTCIDSILMANYTELNDTETLVNKTSQAIGGIVSYKCEPFDCNGNGRCVNGTCVCNPGISIRISATTNVKLYVVGKHFWTPKTDTCSYVSIKV